MKLRHVTFRSSFKNFRELLTNLTVRYIVALVTIAVLVGVTPFVVTEMMEQQEGFRQLIVSSSKFAKLGRSLGQALLSYELVESPVLKKVQLKKIQEMGAQLEIFEAGFRESALKFKNRHESSADLQRNLETLQDRYESLTSTKRVILNLEGRYYPENSPVILSLLNDGDQFSNAVQAFILSVEKISTDKLREFKRIEWAFTSVLILIMILQGFFVLRPAVQKVELTLTNLKISEEMLVEAKEQAVQALRLRSEFVTKISHEIRNPLNAILGMGDLLLETPLDMGQKRYVEISRRAGQSILDLINDFLDFSRLEAGKLELERIEFDLIDTLERSIDIVANRAEDKGLELNLDFDPNLPVRLMGDPKRLQQILVNLLGNAVKFTNTGEITLKVRQEKKPGTKNYYMFEVKDSGIGIPKDLQTRIFDSFIQVDSSITRKFGGNGLGLTICSDLSKMMGGQITLESERGKGSTFRVYLPFDPAFPETFLSRFKNIPFEELSVLIVDRNLRRRETIMNCLSLLGTRVQAVSTIDVDVQWENYRVIIIDHCELNEMSFLNQLPDKVKLICFSKLRDLRYISNLLSAYKGHLCIPKPVKISQIVATLIDIQKGMKRKRLSISAIPKEVELAPSKVLVVEDSEDNRFVIQSFLRNTPLDLIFAVNGKEGLDKFKCEPFDLVFMDMQMPVMDGFAATRSIRQFEVEQRKRRTPIIALSAYGNRDEVQMCLDAGCDRHVTKPVRKAILLKVIQDMIPETESSGVALPPSHSL